MTVYKIINGQKQPLTSGELIVDEWYTAVSDEKGTFQHLKDSHGNIVGQFVPQENLGFATTQTA
jgi:hypothetical protein